MISNSKVALIAAVTFFSLTSHISVAQPDVSPFYQSVMQMKAEGKLGQVIKQEKIQTPIKGAQAWRIAYISSDVSERPTISTGLVVAPIGKAPVGGRPIMAWSHGTTGTAQNCGPSQVVNPAVPLNEYFLIGGNSWTDYGLPSLEAFIKEGYIVVGTDYQGLGGGGRHQYLTASTQGRDVINSARAVASMPEVDAGKKTVVYGWSQGGASTIAAASLSDYIAKKGTASDGLEFLGFVALAPADMGSLVGGKALDQAVADKAIADSIQAFSGNIFNFTHFAMYMWGTQAAFPHLKLTDIFTDEGVKVFNEVFLNKCMHAASDTLNFSYANNYKTLLKDRPSNTLEWAKAFVRGSTPQVKPVAPVVVYWGTKDVVAPPAMGKFYQAQKCALGGNVDRVQLPGEQSHFTTPGASVQFYLLWIKDRLAGRPASDGCAAKNVS